ncbi:uncharacterized protein LOC120337686 [Styela clava]
MNLNNLQKNGDLNKIPAVLIFLNLTRIAKEQYSLQKLYLKSVNEMAVILYALLNQRIISRDDVLGSPAQRLLARRIKTNLPIAKSLLEPKVVPTTQVHAQLTHKRMQQKKYFDKTAKSLPPLQRGDKVRLQTDKGYNIIGIIKKKAPEPRSYIVSANGKKYRRNRRHLLHVQERFDPSIVYDDSDLPIPMLSNTSQSNADIPPQRPPNQVNQSHHYITRSGRVSKPNNIYHDYVV